MERLGTWITLLCLTVLLSMGGCETGQPHRPLVRDGKTYGATKGTFRGRWWNYYERGASFADGRFLREAEADLREAIRQRDQDRRRALTYGMHFISYFPHRELGVVLFHQSRYQEAIEELATSLESEKSAKAEFYLDAARRSLLEKDSRDAGPPQISIREPDDGLLTNRLSCRVTGLVRDDTFVESVVVSGMPVRLDLAASEVALRMDVPLQAGENIIRIEAADLTGKTVAVERRVRVDLQGPIISLDVPMAEGTYHGRRFRLRGYIYDDSGVADVRINGRDWPHSQGREVRLDYLLPSVPDGERFVIEAKDPAGNRTRAEIPLSGQTSSLPGLLLASAGPFQLARLLDPDGRPDTTRPVIEIRNWTSEQTVFMDQVYLEGTVRGDNRIKSLSINGQSVLRRAGNIICFSHLAKLNEGANTISIEAADEAGKTAQETITIHRKLQKMQEVGSRLKLALMPLERKGDVKLDSEPIEENLLAGLIERKRFDMVERRRLDDILKELNLSRSELADPESGIRVGKIVSANGALMGSVVGRGDSLEIFLRLVDTETSLIVATVDVYGEDIDSRGLRELCHGLILKLHDELPLVSGTIVQMNGSRALTDLGKESRVKKGMRLIIFDEGEPIRHPVTQAILGSKVETLGHALIQTVHEKMSDAEVVEKEALERIKPMHRVMTQ